MAPFDEPYYPYYPPTVRRAAAGIKAKSQRGAIGQTWWSQQFIAVLESFRLGGRLTRGKSYARTGQVLDLEVSPGVVSARVQGSRARPYQVSIGLTVLSERDWRAAEDALAGEALYLAMLLAGEMPQDIGEVFRACKLALFPASHRDLVTQCSCPDYANPCKHIAATYYILAEAFDEDPFLILAWRGRPKDVLLANLRLLRQDSPSVGEVPAGPAAAGPSGAGVPPLEESLAGFWSAGPELAELHVRPVPAVVPDAVLRQLDPIDLGLGTSLADELRPAYERMAALAPASWGEGASWAGWAGWAEEGDPAGETAPE
ncbi:MAG TPA: SWIM zinc finger family protein [Actinomycetota bacterium]|nr:SWIM zinc finger family protein [Actinomycetota bacterium]